MLLVLFLVAELLQREPMLDLGLLRVPTFGGGLIAGWAISAALFAVLTYLIIYMQNLLGMSAVATGVRFLPLTLAIFVTAGIAGGSPRTAAEAADRRRVPADRGRPC